MSCAQPPGRPTSHGSARLVGAAQAGLTRMGPPATAFPLGVAPGLLGGGEYGLTSWPPGQNLMVLGPPRSGKGASFFLPTLLSLSDRPIPRPSVIVSDPKGELLAISRPRLEAAGYDVHVIVLSDPSLSDPWNPLEWLRADDGDIDYASVQALALALAPPHPQEQQPIWADLARMVIGTAAVLAVRMAAAAGREATLADALSLAYLLVRVPGEVAKIAQGIDPWAEQQLSVFAAALAADERLQGNVAIDAPARYQSWTTPPMLSLLSRPSDWTWEQVLDTPNAPHAVFVLASPTQQAQQAVLWSSLMAAGVKLQRRHGRLVRPVWLLMDEFSNIGPVASIMQALTVLPGAGVSTVLGLQSTSQVETVYSAQESHAILASLHGYLALPGLDHVSAQWVSDHLGVGTTRTQHRQTDRHGSVQWLSEQHQRRVMEPDEVASLPPGQILVQRIGYYGTRLQAVQYYRRRAWAAEARAGDPRSPEIGLRLAAMRHPVEEAPTIEGLWRGLLDSYMGARPPAPVIVEEPEEIEVEDTTDHLRDLLR